MKFIKTLQDGTRIYHWNRKEQIAHAKEVDALDEMRPPLKVSEKT